MAKWDVRGGIQPSSPRQEMDGPFDGLIRASPDPLMYALAHLDR
ncbi:hypothetical protein LJR084_006565 [Variovorax sp. LjRoot84]